MMLSPFFASWIWSRILTPPPPFSVDLIEDSRDADKPGAIEGDRR
jgi:hypothetical protein